MKKNIFLVIFISIILISGGIYLFNLVNKSNNNQSSNYIAERTATENNISNQISENNSIQESTTQNQTNNEEITAKEEKPVQHVPVETEISTYTTKIQAKYSSRQNNITLACSALNDTIVEAGSTFSFNQIVGKPSPEKGYQKANVFKNGDEVKGYGGGKCQISSTLYNAVLKIPELKVVERHKHSAKVYYVPEGKDAAVSYGTYDFKFKNNMENSIKIKASNTKNEVTIKLLKLE